MSGFKLIELIWLFTIGIYFLIPCYAWLQDHSQQYRHRPVDHFFIRGAASIKNGNCELLIDPESGTNNEVSCGTCHQKGA